MKTKNLSVLIALFITIFTLSSCINATAKTKNTGKTTVTPNNHKTQETAKISRVEAKAFNTAIDGKEVQLVDVRTPKEFEQGHIKNAININVYDGAFTTKTAKLDKTKPVYVYCRSGARSMKAAGKLKANGYNVVNLNGGVIGWSRSGYSLVK